MSRRLPLREDRTGVLALRRRELRRREFLNPRESSAQLFGGVRPSPARWSSVGSRTSSPGELLHRSPLSSRRSLREGRTG
jgi:hypothetical protein